MLACIFLYIWSKKISFCCLSDSKCLISRKMEHVTAGVASQMTNTEITRCLQYVSLAFSHWQTLSTLTKYWADTANTKQYCLLNHANHVR